MVIETQEELQSCIKDLDEHDIIMVPVLCDQRKHVLNNSLSFIFIKILDEPRYYILPFNHNECINLDISTLIQINTSKKKYVFDKKQLMNIFPFQNIIDINLMYYFNTNLSLDLMSFYKPTKSQLLIQKEYEILKDLNEAIPILKFFETLSDLSTKLESVISENRTIEDEPYFNFTNNDTLYCLHKIEQSGLKVDAPLAVEKFPHSKLHISKDSYMHTEYNVYTATGRPSNRFGNTNFAALNTDNGERAIIKSRFDGGDIVMFDYDAYHFMLIAKLANYEFPTDINVHEFLGRQYFGKESLNEEEYSESKAVSFNIMYGGIDKSVADAIPFFGKASDFIDDIWNKSRESGYVESVISKRKIYTKDFNRNKLFNYILQNYETERNITVIQKILSKIKSSETKLILYVYDGFVFDMHPDEKFLEDELQSIIEDGGFKTKKFIGKNFHKLQKVR